MNDNLPENVHILDVPTLHNLSPDRVLLAAVGQLDSVVLLGYDIDGNPYVSSSEGDSHKVIGIISALQYYLHRIAE